MTYTRNRKPDNIDAVTALGITGFSWNRPFTDYSQLSVPSGQTKPTEAAIAAKLSELTTEWNNSDYQRKRAAAYPNLADQLDMQYWDKKNGTTTWVDAVAKVKSDNPKS